MRKKKKKKTKKFSEMVSKQTNKKTETQISELAVEMKKLNVLGFLLQYGVISAARLFPQ